MENYIGIIGLFTFISVFVYSVIETIKNIANLFSFSKSKIWNEIMLPLIPLMLGAAIGKFGEVRIMDYNSKLIPILFCAVAGSLSGTVYKIVKKLIEQRVEGKLEK